MTLPSAMSIVLLSYLVKSKKFFLNLESFGSRLVTLAPNELEHGEKCSGKIRAQLKLLLDNLQKKVKHRYESNQGCSSMLLLVYYLAPLQNDSRDVTMRAVHFWGQERSLPIGRECPTCD